MFMQCYNAYTMRAAALLAVATAVPLSPDYRMPDPDIGAAAIVFLTAGRTVGTVACVVQGSNDGGLTWYNLDVASYTCTITANGYRTLFFRGSVPPHIQVTVTPGAGFDGTLAIYRYDGRAAHHKDFRQGVLPRPFPSHMHSLMDLMVGPGGIAPWYKLDNVIFVDAASVGGSYDGSIFRPYPNYATAIAAAVAGDTIAIAPATYAEVMTGKAGVYVIALGPGVIFSKVGPVLTLAAATTFDGITFVVTDAATMGTITTCVGTFKNCTFTFNGADANALQVLAAGSLIARGCSFLQTTALFDAITLDDSANTLALYDCTYRGEIVIADGTFLVDQLNGTGAITVAAATASGNVRMERATVTSALDTLDLGTTGTVNLFDNDFVSTGGGFAALIFNTAPGTLHANHNRLYGAQDIEVATGVAAIATTFGDNAMGGGRIVCVGTGTFSWPALTKSVGGRVDAYADMDGAIASLTANSTLLVEPGTYTTALAAGLAPAVNGTVKGRGSREQIIIQQVAAPGDPVFDLDNGIRFTLEGISFIGSIDIDDAATVVRINDCVGTGMIDVVSGTNTTGVYVKDSIIYGDATDLYALRVRDVDPILYTEGSVFHGVFGGVGTEYACYLDVVNNNLHSKDDTWYHGAGGANTPFGQPGGGPFATNWTGFRYAINVALPAWLTNLIAPGQEQSTIDVGAAY
jgi:hypothetical protein